ncbi:MAG: sigma-70 family RNA polymerase sigma factor [Deltaproteobacteria bacterium]|jgi:RNA polymerase sigma-70 factor (ECF subfamily)|nr:sigma-70 family RNA polymerase sigma factor [Deltaproteobacteria bacterium]MBW2532704.1 sigma-70 family RNA polymerase sigma factor [Deltaproteobacteria bacterium]
MSTRAASSTPTRLSDPWEDEAALLQQVADGDRAASRELVDRYLGAITRFAFRLLGDRAEAEDVAQESFLRLWRQARRWEPKAKLSTWLYRVAHNLCIDRLRAKKTRAEAPPDGDEASLDASDLLERRRVVDAVAAALEELPERQRAALALTYYEGLRNYEAAEVMDVSVEALESLLARARRQLKKRLRSARGSPPSHAERGAQSGATTAEEGKP